FLLMLVGVLSFYHTVALRAYFLHRAVATGRAWVVLNGIYNKHPNPRDLDSQHFNKIRVKSAARRVVTGEDACRAGQPSTEIRRCLRSVLYTWSRLLIPQRCGMAATVFSPAKKEIRHVQDHSVDGSATRLCCRPDWHGLDPCIPSVNLGDVEPH